MTLQNISIITSGSRGDIQPYIALGSALKSAGYNIRILTNIDHASFVQNFDIPYVPVFQDMREMMKNPVWKEAMAEGDFQVLAQSLDEMEREYAPNASKAFLEETQQNPTDLLIAGTLADYYWYYAFRVMNIPTLKVSLQAIVYDPKRAPFGLPTLPEGKHYDILVSIIGGFFDNAMKHQDEAMKLNGGSMLLPRFSKSKLLENWEKPFVPHIVCQSPLFKDILYPRAHPNYHFVGASIVDGTQQQCHSENFGGDEAHDLIEKFLAADPERKPVYCGWGSMICKSAEYMVEFAVRALMVSDQRGIVLGGWACLSMDTLRNATSDSELIAYAEKNVLFVKQASHENLFPRVACTVHHGGAGTTNAALRAGVPTIVTPVFVDQYDHAHLVTELGVGIGFAEQLQKLTAEELGAAMKKVVTNDDVVKRAKEFGAKLREEDGAAAVVSQVENFWNDYVSTGRLWNIIDAKLKEVDDKN